MEGIYFFGEHVRWNLGWSNPNQAGVFIAMLIPWLWGLGSFAGSGSRRMDLFYSLLLAAELSLWFLLCKTYSRGALVAVGLAGVAFFLWRYIRDRKFSERGLMAVRLSGIGVLLVLTGFFSRIDPRFVSQDASAGNRIVLWKGGLQMIAVSPWQGWGNGQSGSGFMHWFQPLESHEMYAGMVNSYLHVGVEYGLPLLVLVMSLALGLLALSWGCGRECVGVECSSNQPSRDGASNFSVAAFLMAAGCSWLVFLIANVFSTLWIFKNLWWVPAVDCAVIPLVSWKIMGGYLPRMVARVSAWAFIFSLCAAMVLFITGKLMPREVRIAFHPSESLVVASGGGNAGRMLFYPDASVLGDDWGKEIRRLAAAEKFLDFEIFAPLTDSSHCATCSNPQVIVACGSRFSDGISALLRFPEAHLILVHPVGKPILPEGMTGKVSVILPMLDTRNNGRAWKTISKLKGWPISTSAGVGQDIRALWPGALVSIR